MNPRGGDVDAEAIVCGAGAAGLSSAAMLQRAGVQTLVLERSDQIQVKAAAWLGINRNTLHKKVDDFRKGDGAANSVGQG